MKIQNLEMADMSLVEIRNGTPHCMNHGAMNKITKEGIWRCVTSYKVRKEIRGKSPIEIVDYNSCRAGCLESKI